MLDIWFMMLFGVIGYLFKKLNYPLAPLVLALVLGDRAEDSFRQSMLIAQGDVRIFFSNGLVGGITGLALVLLFWPVVARYRPPAWNECARGPANAGLTRSDGAGAYGVGCGHLRHGGGIRSVESGDRIPAAAGTPRAVHAVSPRERAHQPRRRR
jgi:hypothetical protein